MEKIVVSKEVGQEMYAFIQQLFPICRSITGVGVRETLGYIREIIPYLVIHGNPSGERVFDWTIPEEWNIRDAYIKDAKGNKIVDFKKNNLHIWSYSISVNRTFSFQELQPHLHTMPEYPDWIPYRTTYYKEDWGFCLTHAQYLTLNQEEHYQVVIDSKLASGMLNWAQYLKSPTLRPNALGRDSNEILISTYVCHPSMCNDNLSGVALTTFLAKMLANVESKYAYRFLFLPETIGAIAWLAHRETVLHREEYGDIAGGLVATCVGDSGYCTYKRSRIGDALIDRSAEKALADSGNPYKVVDFFPWGSDERQFCSPGFDFAVGSLMRTPYDEFPEYHTSADNLSFISPDALADSLQRYLDVIYILENDATYINLNPKCEPQLGKRGLYDPIGGTKSMDEILKGIFWVLNYSDGQHSLLDISIKAKMSFEIIKIAADRLLEKELLKEVSRE